MDVLINLDVDDLEKAVRFYADAFGLRPARRLGAFSGETLGNSVPICLLAKATGTPVADTSQPRNYERHWTPVHLDFVVEEIAPAVEKAIAVGARLEKPITTHVWGELAVLADPFGHDFCFVQFLGRCNDEITVQ